MAGRPTSLASELVLASGRPVPLALTHRAIVTAAVMLVSGPLVSAFTDFHTGVANQGAQGCQKPHHLLRPTRIVVLLCTSPFIATETSPRGFMSAVGDLGLRSFPIFAPMRLGHAENRSRPGASRLGGGPGRQHRGSGSPETCQCSPILSRL